MVVVATIGCTTQPLLDPRERGVEGDELVTCAGFGTDDRSGTAAREFDLDGGVSQARILLAHDLNVDAGQSRVELLDANELRDSVLTELVRDFEMTAANEDLHDDLHG